MSARPGLANLRPVKPGQVGFAHPRTSHGARSNAALAPQVVSMKKGLLARMGLRQRELTWAGRELLDTYCRAKAKVVAIDHWLETNELIRADGTAPAVMGFYLAALNTSTRTLEALRGVIADMAREDDRLDTAVSALAAEGRRIRAERELPLAGGDEQPADSERAGEGRQDEQGAHSDVPTTSSIGSGPDVADPRTGDT